MSTNNESNGSNVAEFCEFFVSPPKMFTNDVGESISSVVYIRAFTSKKVPNHYSLKNREYSIEDVDSFDRPEYPLDRLHFDPIKVFKRDIIENPQVYGEISVAEDREKIGRACPTTSREEIHLSERFSPCRAAPMQVYEEISVAEGREQIGRARPTTSREESHSSERFSPYRAAPLQVYGEISVAEEREKIGRARPTTSREEIHLSESFSPCRAAPMQVYEEISVAEGRKKIGRPRPTTSREESHLSERFSPCGAAPMQVYEEISVAVGRERIGRACPTKSRRKRHLSERFSPYRAAPLLVPPEEISLHEDGQNQHSAICSQPNSALCPQDGKRKPPFGYASLCVLVLSTVEDATVTEMYQIVENFFPYFETAKRNWENSLRHELSKPDRKPDIFFKTAAKNGRWKFVPGRSSVERKLDKILLSRKAEIINSMRDTQQWHHIFNCFFSRCESSV